MGSHGLGPFLMFIVSRIDDRHQFQTILSSFFFGGRGGGGYEARVLQTTEALLCCVETIRLKQKLSFS